MLTQGAPRRRLIGAAGVAICAAALLSRQTQAGTGAFTVLAASTLMSALDSLAAAYRSTSGSAMQMVYGPSSVLERSLGQGIAADIFFPASSAWMDRAQAARLIRPATRHDLLTSRLVLFARRGNVVDDLVGDGLKLSATLAPRGRLAICNPDLIVSGDYARASLHAMGQWETVQASIVIAIDEQMLRGIVATGDAALGIAFDTDVASDSRLEIVGVLPEGSHPPIVFPVALTSTASPLAVRLLDYLGGREAAALFTRYGYGLAGRPT